MAARVAEILRSTSGIAEIIDEAFVENTISWRVRFATLAGADNLIANMCDVGVGVVHLATIEPDLEKTFLELTSGKITS